MLACIGFQNISSGAGIENLADQILGFVYRKYQYLRFGSLLENLAGRLETVERSVLARPAHHALRGIDVTHLRPGQRRLQLRRPLGLALPSPRVRRRKLPC